jgi:urea transport system permease protein
MAVRAGAGAWRVAPAEGPAPAWLAGLVFLALAAIPLLGGDYWTGQSTRYLCYGLFAMSLSLVWGRGGILCFGQAIFFGMGGYAMAALTKQMGPAWLAGSVPALAAAVLLPALAAAALGYFLFWGRGLSGAYLAIVTLTLSIIGERLMVNWYAMGGFNGLLDVPVFSLGLPGFEPDTLSPLPMFYLLLGVSAAAYAAIGRLLLSPFGILLTAVRDNPRRAEFFGYEVLPIKLAAFVLGAALAGLAGGLFVSVAGFASPTLLGAGLSTEVLIWVALGGRGMPLAAMLGAIVTRLVEGELAESLGEAWPLALGLLFMASVVLLPRGLIATPLDWLAARLKVAPATK